MSVHCKDKCIICGKYLQYGHKTNMCRKCRDESVANDKLSHWLSTGDTGCSVNSRIRGKIRKYILNDQNGQCAICGISEIWNGKHLELILDHIDGNADNNVRTNLRLICPNCDSQLPTYKSRNKNSARAFRKVGPRAIRGVQKVDMLSGNVLAVYKSVRDASIQTGISESAIYSAANGFREQTGGFRWVYV